MYWKERAGIACSTLRERNSAAFMIPCQMLANRCCDCSTSMGRPTALSNPPTGWLDNSRKTPWGLYTECREDGNLVLYYKGRARWNSGTVGHRGAICVM